MFWGRRANREWGAEAEAGVDRKERPLRLDDLGFGEGRPKTRGGVSVSPPRKISGQT